MLKSHSLTITLSHSHTLSVSHSWHAEQLLFSCLCSKVTLTLSHSLNHSLSHSHLTLSLTHLLTLDMLKNFCFHVYTQKSLYHYHSLTHSRSHSHTISVSHSLTLNMLNNFCFHVYAEKSLSRYQSDWPGGPERAEGAVGGQGPLHEVSNFACDDARDLILASNSRVLGMGNLLGPIPEASDWPGGWEWAEGAVGDNGPLQGVYLISNPENGIFALILGKW